MAHLGFGGHLIWGQPIGPIEQALAPCDGMTHGVAPWGPPGYNMPKEFLDGMNAREYPPYYLGDWPPERGHGREGFPSFGWWPFSETIIHQQMYVDWIRRAYNGGLRLMSALAVNNRLTAWLMEGRNEPNRPDCWDNRAISDQLTMVKILAEGNRDWMEIAYSARDAERIVGENKLAIVLGVEVDQVEWMVAEEAFAIDPVLRAQFESEMGPYSRSNIGLPLQAYV